jgi:hypothetical protein
MTRRRSSLDFRERIRLARLALRPDTNWLMVAYADACTFNCTGRYACEPQTHQHAEGSDVVEIVHRDRSVTEVMTSR